VRPYIIGTVTESGGTPTGGIIEYGTGANGHFVRFADGLMVCWHTPTVAALAIATALFGGFRSAGQTWTYPSEFVAAPVVEVTAYVASAFGAVTGLPTTTTVAWSVTAVTTQGTADRTVSLVAVGRWFA
jgi:hypothetical protein